MTLPCNVSSTGTACKLKFPKLLFCLQPFTLAVTFTSLPKKPNPASNSRISTYLFASIPIWHARVDSCGVESAMLWDIRRYIHLQLASNISILASTCSLHKMGSSPADLLTNQAVLKHEVHCHTLWALPVGIEPATPQSRAVALPTAPQIPPCNLSGVSHLVVNVYYLKKPRICHFLLPHVCSFIWSRTKSYFFPQWLLSPRQPLRAWGIELV